jgi:hypothetical protein
MAIVIQEVVGNRFENAFYPHISGTAQSFNFYPVSHMTPQDGFAVLAVGLGHYVVEGERAFRFSPVYPSLSILFRTKIFIKIPRLSSTLSIWQRRNLIFSKEKMPDLLHLISVRLKSMVLLSIRLRF